MLDNRYLLYGINALSRAHEFNYFLDGHRGGAIVSGVYLCRENDIEAGVADQVAALIDEHWSHTALCAPFPAEDSNPALLSQIINCIQAHLAGLREAGHNVILPTLALKAFRDVPEAITPSRVNGICRLVESFTITDVPGDAIVELPDMRDFASAANFILSEFVQCVARFIGRGQGWSGHLLTYGKALLDLRDLGYEALASQAEEGFKIYVRRIRMGPQESDKPRQEHAPTDLFPLQEAYWRARVGDLTFGHQLKYPYGFYGLMTHAQDPEIKRQCLHVAYRLF